jgi:hypothetical protein
MKTEEEVINEETEKHIKEDINWGACLNPIIKIANESESGRDDVEQFASDSFWYGWQRAKEYFKNNP